MTSLALITPVLVLAGCQSTPPEPPTAVQPTTAAKPDVEQKPQAPAVPVRTDLEVSPLAAAKLLSRVENDGADDLAFQPGTQRLVASGRMVHQLSPEQRPLDDISGSFRNVVVGADGTIYGDETRFVPGAKPDTFSVLQAQDKRMGRELSSAAYTGDGRYLGVVVDWRPPRGRPVKDRDGKAGYRYSRPNKPPSPHRYVEVFDAATGESVTPRTETGLSHIIAGPSALVVVDVQKPLLFDVTTKKLRELPVPEGAHVSRNVAFSPGGGWLAGIGTRGQLFVWRAAELIASDAMLDRKTGVASIAAHPGGALFVGLQDGTMMFVDPTSGEIMQEWTDRDENELNRHEIGAAAISSDGKRLATAHGLLGRVVRIWALDVE